MLDKSTFEYLPPTVEQLEVMGILRVAAAVYAGKLEQFLPDGADKTYALRKLREVAMWANVAVTREGDGRPRRDDEASRVEYPPGHPAPGDLGSVPL